MKIDLNSVPAFYQGYVQPIADSELIPLLLKSGDDLVSLCRSLSDQQALHKYAPDKWSIKDLVQHLIDAERVFVYRAMRFSRHDQTELSGFDENEYALEAGADQRPLHQMTSEFTNLRASTIDFFSSISEEKRKRKGKSNDVEMSVDVLGYVIAGHTLHHLGIIKERYFK